MVNASIFHSWPNLTPWHFATFSTALFVSMNVTFESQILMICSKLCLKWWTLCVALVQFIQWMLARNRSLICHSLGFVFTKTLIGCVQRFNEDPFFGWSSSPRFSLFLACWNVLMINSPIELSPVESLRALDRGWTEQLRPVEDSWKKSKRWREPVRDGAVNRQNPPSRDISTTIGHYLISIDSRHQKTWRYLPRFDAKKRHFASSLSQCDHWKWKSFWQHSIKNLSPLPNPRNWFVLWKANAFSHNLHSKKLTKQPLH